jgi:adenylosuccinate lyase
VISRYTRKEMGGVWSDERRMRGWLEVELAATDAWAAEGKVPAEAAVACRERASFTVEAVKERERETNHDVAAFVDVVAASIGEQGRWIHYGLTSSDVLDTALALQLVEAGLIIVSGATAYRDALVAKAREHAETLCVGRTHGVHAEPTTFGLRLAGFAFEADRNLSRLRSAFEGAAVGKLSGAVGTYASTPPQIEAAVMEELGLGVEDISTQVVPRDRHAAVLEAIALAGAGLERFAQEVRNLQRTEVREVEEFFAEGQKGSSAMPHKRNPILGERLCGMARLVRGYALTAMENVALWHERDISHSSAERVILPDATIALDYMLSKLDYVVRTMNVYPKNMQKNLELTRGLLHSQQVLLLLTEKGISREMSYKIVQTSAMKAWETGAQLKDLLRADKNVMGKVTDKDLEKVFDIRTHFRDVNRTFREVGL